VDLRKAWRLPQTDHLSLRFQIKAKANVVSALAACLYLMTATAGN
jgi:hypothetical protein